MRAIVMLVTLGSSLACMGVANELEDVRIEETRLRIAQVEQRVEIYRLQNGKLPELSQLGIEIRDGWGNKLHLAENTVRGSYDLTSYGADGKPGGFGANEDIGRND